MLDLSVVNGEVVGFKDKNQIYIGRKYGNRQGSILANPFIIGRDGTREEIIEKYRRWLWSEYKKNGSVKQELVAIAERVKNGEKVKLVCWCHPKKCHGDVIKNCISWMLKDTIKLDRSPRLTIELVPSTCWFSNVRSNVTKEQWNRLRKDTYKKANYRCEICGGQGSKHPVECHEIWHYDDENLVQRLDGLIALCPSCHQCKHIGLATVNGKQEEAIFHLAKVNNWEFSKAVDYTEKSFEIWKQRSEHQWKLDISYLTRFGIKIESEFNIRV